MTSIYVPSDCTLKEAIFRSNRCDTQTTIFLEKDIYDIQARRSLICVQKYLIITKPVCIIGNDSIINGGLFISDNIEGNIYLENLHISHRLGTGIIGKSSFIVKNVSIRNCEDDGILLYGPSVNTTCTNVQVLNCRGIGISSENGANVVIGGIRTKINGNTYGIVVCYSSISQIKIEYPLTKESISSNNEYNLKAFGRANLYQIQNVYTEV